MLKKSLFAVLFLISAQAAYADGEIYCSSPSNPGLFSAAVATSWGAPLAEALQINFAKSGQSYQIARDQAVQYKNSPSEVYILAVDADFFGEALVLDAKASKGRRSNEYRGTLTLTNDGKKATYRVVCKQRN